MNINFGLHSQRRKGDFKLMRYQPRIVRPVIPLSANTDTGHLVLFEDCGSILLAVGRLDYIVITSYVSQLVNHLRTRTPMGDLAEQSRLALDSHYAYSI